MTGTLYGTATFHWVRGFVFGATLGAIAALIMIFLVKRPTVEQMEEAVRKNEDKAAVPKAAVA